MLFRGVDLHRQTRSELHQEIHPLTKSAHWCPVYRKTSQVRVAQNDSVQQPFVAAKRDSNPAELFTDLQLRLGRASA
jgi:hypothetical protein